MQYIFDNFILAYGIRQLMVFTDMVLQHGGVQSVYPVYSPGHLLGILFAAGTAMGFYKLYSTSYSYTHDMSVCKLTQSATGPSSSPPLSIHTPRTIR